LQEKQKKHAQHVSCFLFAGLEQGDGDPPNGGEHPSQRLTRPPYPPIGGDGGLFHLY
jgi:hypothetical protein